MKERRDSTRGLADEVCDVKVIMVNNFLRGYEWILQCLFPVPVINATTTTRF